MICFFQFCQRNPNRWTLRLGGPILRWDIGRGQCLGTHGTCCGLRGGMRGAHADGWQRQFEVSSWSRQVVQRLFPPTEQCRRHVSVRQRFASAPELVPPPDACGGGSGWYRCSGITQDSESTIFDREMRISMQYSLIQKQFTGWRSSPALALRGAGCAVIHKTRPRQEGTAPAPSRPRHPVSLEENGCAVEPRGPPRRNRQTSAVCTCLT